MIRIALMLLLSAAPAFAADRTIATGSFDRVRVSGPYEVRIASGRSPGVTISGDRRAIEAVTVRTDGQTLVVRPDDADVWGERGGGSSAGLPIVTLTTPSLVAATSFGGGRLTIARMAGDRIDVAISGAGAVTVADVRTPLLNATVVGSGVLTLAGRAEKARLVSNGPGSVDATALDASDLIVHLDGTGETKAKARYTAEVTNSGIGTVIVQGNPKCSVRQGAGGPVRCGPGR